VRILCLKLEINQGYAFRTLTVPSDDTWGSWMISQVQFWVVPEVSPFQHTLFSTSFLWATH